MNFSVIIPFYNGNDTIDRLIKSIPNTIEIVIVDDHSSHSLQTLSYSNVKIIRANKKGYFAGAVNNGINSTRGDVLILNQDTYFTGNSWLQQLEDALHEGYSFIGERIKGTRKDWPNGYIHGTFMYMTRELIDKTGLFNQQDFPMWGCTAEYQLRAARNNFKVLPLTQVQDFVHVRPNEQKFGKSFQSLLNIEKNKSDLFVSTPPLVSVIIPTHNYSQWLHSTVNCLVGGQTDLGLWQQQTFAAFEVLIVDDSSTDNTPEIIESVVDPWKGVRSIRLDRPRDEVWNSYRNKYTGKVIALNQGIKEAYGKYILALDADDMMYPERIEKFYREQIKNPHSFIYDNLQLFGDGQLKEFVYPQYMAVVDENGLAHRADHPKAGQSTLYPKVDPYDFEVLIYKNHVHNSIMFPKSAWKEIGGYPERFKYGREDWAMAVKLGMNGYCGIRLDYHGLLYRREGHNRTLENTKAEWMKYFQTQMRKEFTSLYNGERPMGCCGKGANSSSAQNRTQAFANKGIKNMKIASEGTSWIEYIGGRTNKAAFSTWGFVSGTQYRVTPGKPFIADNRDLVDNSKQKKGILQKVEFGKLMFRLKEEIAAPVTPVVEEEVVQVEVVQDFQEVVQDFQPGFNLDILKTVSTAKEALKTGGYDEQELTAILAYERANKNRESVIAAIETLLYPVET